jgi:hypothetical protein
LLDSLLQEIQTLNSTSYYDGTYYRFCKTFERHDCPPRPSAWCEWGFRRKGSKPQAAGSM